MRRKDKEIADSEEIGSIIEKSLVCRLAMCDGGIPYIVPMSFGLRGNSLYFHCAREGRKLDIMKANPAVCFEFDADCEIVPSDSPCSIGMKYRSVIGRGTVAIIEDRDEVRLGLDCIVEHYGGKPGDISDEMLNRTVVLRVDIQEMTGKKSGY